MEYYYLIRYEALLLNNVYFVILLLLLLLLLFNIKYIVYNINFFKQKQNKQNIKIPF